MPGFSGFFSKDEIIWSAYAAHTTVGKIVWLMGTAVAFFTPFYTFRLIFLTFHGTFRGGHHAEAQDTVQVMARGMIPDMALAMIHRMVPGHGAHDSHHGEHHIHESPKIMTVPLMFLAFGAVAAGWVGIPPILGGGAHFAHFLVPVVGHPEFHGTHAEEWTVMGISTTIALIGIALAAFLYLRKSDLPERSGVGTHATGL